MKKSLNEREFLAAGVYQAMHPSLADGLKVDKKGIESAKARLQDEIKKCNEELAVIEAEERTLIARKNEIIAEFTEARDA
ncbi:hypothetical protein GL50803_0011341 [Giardia duodenalis]|uniref:Uncharacterized protein n=1 Tax=Giardia intestinalis (strain ATCC 50803 / WB clone C6) TaxID=184922 RepID=A8B8L8_GIAIC|nr:hypothetical protein GL50803_0011341 [Giardia intestinalis]KAE8302432.1 hypothetical protein GL50803_0011341 [Giardia intestinalis]|eukprot:XP_001708637.1 Hypothetical protein GL50803_11341 [Giardia lamblia ATCC 50803]